MSFAVVQRGSKAGPLVVGFHLGEQALLAACRPLESASVLAELASTYTVPPSWEELEAAGRKAGWAEGPMVLVGWSAGCAALRAYLRAGRRPACVVALDGTSGPKGQVPALDWAVAPWREAANRARAGEALLVLSHTYQVYTEQLPLAERYPATVSIVRAATGLELPEPSPLSSPFLTREGDLVVLSCASRAIDRRAHEDQQSVTLPYTLSRFVAPWLASREDTADEGPGSGRDGTGETALEVALLELAAGAREEPVGSNAGPRVREYLAGCVRDLDGDGDDDPLRLGAAEWCAAFVGWCDSQAGVQRPWRAAVSEICRDAVQRGMLREAKAYDPLPGDLAIFRRAGQDPRRGGLGHVARVVLCEGARLVTVDGNHWDAVARVERSTGDPELVAWVEYPHRPKDWTHLGTISRTSDLAAGRAPGGGVEAFVSTDEGPVIPG